MAVQRGGLNIVEHVDDVESVVIRAVRDRLGDSVDEYMFPPPVFTAMQGQFLEVDFEAESITVRFPILDTYLNPYGSLQGGIIATIVDNTLGPLSMLVADSNVTRHLEMTYSRPIPLAMGYVVVTARLLEREGHRLSFAAEVRSPSGQRLARAKAVHWVLDGPE